MKSLAALDPRLLAVLLIAAGMVWLDRLGTGVSLRPPMTTTQTEAALLAHRAQTEQSPMPSDDKDSDEAKLADPFWPQASPKKSATSSSSVAPAPVVVPPPIVASSPLPTPHPTLPFRYLGRMRNADGREIILLGRGADKDFFEAQSGAMIGDFRVIGVDATRMDFEHIPTGERLSLDMPAPDRSKP